MSVVQIDFGKDARDATRTFRKLLGLLQEMDRDILANPIKYFQQASGEITRLRRILDEAKEAERGRVMVSQYLGDSLTSYEPIETVTITKADYERLKTVARIVRQAELSAKS